MNGDLYFTDQGKTDLADPSGCVYRYTADGVLHRLASCIPSPNGLVLSKAETTLFVAVTRANTVSRPPFSPHGPVGAPGGPNAPSGCPRPHRMAMGEAEGLPVAPTRTGARWRVN